MVPPTFVPETASIADILRQFQESANHFGVVVDEFGQFEGIITMEDVLEEIVGEIQAQNEQGQPSIRRAGPGNYVMDGILSVRDFNRFFPYPLPQNDAYATLAGFLMSELGKLPAAREELAWEHYRFKVEEVQRPPDPAGAAEHSTLPRPSGRPSRGRPSRRDGLTTAAFIDAGARTGPSGCRCNS